MVFAFYCNESGRAPQQLQCGEHLNALSDRHVGIGCAVKKQQRRMDFVGIEEWTMVYIEIFTRPDNSRPYLSRCKSNPNSPRPNNWCGR